jgi:hypothetical protein
MKAALVGPLRGSNPHPRKHSQKRLYVKYPYFKTKRETCPPILALVSLPSVELHENTSSDSRMDMANLSHILKLFASQAVLLLRKKWKPKRKTEPVATMNR